MCGSMEKLNSGKGVAKSLCTLLQMVCLGEVGGGGGGGGEVYIKWIFLFVFDN